MAHRGEKVALETIHLIQVHVGLGELIHLGVEVAIYLSQLVLGVHQPPEHAIECRAEVFKLIPCMNLSAGAHVALPDFIADFAKVLEWFHDHVTDDHIRRQHRQEDGHDGRCEEDGTIPVDRVLRGRIGNHHLHHCHQFVFCQSGTSWANRVGGPTMLMADQTTPAGSNRLVIVILRVVGSAELAVFPGVGGEHRGLRGWRRQAPVAALGITEVVEDGAVERGVSARLIC